MISELIGLPATGKSTLARLLVSKGVIKRSRIENPLSLLFWNAVFWVRFPLRAIRLFLQVIKHSPSLRLFYYKFTNLYLHVNGKYAKALFLGRAIIDQGFVQNCLSLFEYEASESEMKEYFKVAPLPDEVLIFDIPKGEREERMKGRDFKVRDEFNAEYITKWKAISEANFNTLKKVLEQMPLAIVNGNKDEVVERYRRKRIIYLANYRLPTEKAHGLQIAKMCEAFADIGFKVALYVPSKAHNPIKQSISEYYGVKSNFEVKRIWSPDFLAMRILPGTLRFFMQSVWFGLRVLLMKIPNDAICYTRNPLLVRILNVKGVQGIVFESHGLPRRKNLYVKMISKASLVACNSKGTLRDLEKFGIRGRLAPNGVDLKTFENLGSKETLKKESGWNTDVPIVLYTGHLYKWKGVDTLVKAKSLMKGNAAFYLVGGTKGEITDLKTRIGGEQSGVRYIEHIKHERVPAMLRAADILVLPNSKHSEESVSYTSPIKMFEYMASGTPIIASDLPTIREVLDDSCAVFFAPDDAESLAARIDTLLTDKTRRDEVAHAARKKVEQYTWTERAKGIMQI